MSPEQRPTLYDVLGVPPSASIDEIRIAYRKLAQLYHPDKPTGNERLFKLINEANQCLTDPQTRRQYDLSVDGVFPAKPAPKEEESDVARAARMTPRWEYKPNVPRTPSIHARRNTIISIALACIGMIFLSYGDRPAPNYNGWFVAIFWACEFCAYVRFRSR